MFVDILNNKFMLLQQKKYENNNLIKIKSWKLYWKWLPQKYGIYNEYINLNEKWEEIRTVNRYSI